MTGRAGIYKKAGLKFADSKTARARRVEEQKETRRTARQAQNDAKRGIVETVEVPHEQKLQERLAKLKEWREKKAEEQKKAKACKKQPFLVPLAAHPKPDKTAKEQVNTTVMGTTARVTRSQAKKGVQVVEKPLPKSQKKTVKPAAPIKPLKSFAPENFVFSAPKEVAEKALQLKEQPVIPSEQSGFGAILSPERPKADEEIKVSPLLVNNPWITTTRGSSSSKKSRKSVASQDEDVLSSPCLKKRSSNVIRENPEAVKFRTTMNSENSHLTDLCVSWEDLLAAGEVPEEESGSVRTVIGQAQLLQRERFVQFGGLICQFEDKTGEKEITPTDLQGFWEMIYIQVLDVDKKFDELAKLRANGWVKPEETAEPLKKTRAKKKGTAAARPPATRAGKSNMRAYIAAARKNQMTAKSPGVSSPSKRRSSTFLSPMRTPGKRHSLRRSALMNSAKRPVFIVTDAVQKSDEEERKEEATDPENLPRIPPHVSAQADASGVETDPSDTELPAAHANPKNTYGRNKTPHVVSPEERLSAAFDSLKFEQENLDKVSPLKTIRSPAKLVDTPRRRSVRIRALEDDQVGRVSLLPTVTISPVVAQDNLISFD